MSRFKSPHLVACAALYAMGISVTSLAHAQAYTVTNLGLGFANGINNAGQVVGVGAGSHAVIWNGATQTDLGVGNTPTGINDSGQVVGVLPYYFSTQAVRWDGTTPTILGSTSVVEFGSSSTARAINSAGQIVGRSSGVATIWNGTTPTPLGEGYASGINDAGQVVGSSSGGATIWNGTTPTLLSGPFSGAAAINNVGQVVGTVPKNSYPQATLWDGTTTTTLTTLGGYSGATDINNNGLIVGYSAGPPTGFPGPALQPFTHATVWDGNSITDLNNALDSSGLGWTLLEATAINDVGQIVGNGTYGYGPNPFGPTYAYLLTPCPSCQIVPWSAAPVPEPETYAMMLAGLGLLGFFARRKKQNPA